MNQRFDVIGIQRQRAIELLQRLVRLPGELIRHAQQVMRVGEGASGRDDLLEEVNRAVVVLELKALVSLLD